MIIGESKQTTSGQPVNASSPHLFEPFELRDVTLRNRIVVSPMCQYSSVDGFANDWHLVHLGSKAVGGAGLVFMEATAVTPEGRISSWDMGIWDEAHIPFLQRITKFIHEQGSVAGVQLGHAGRKASTHRPWDGRGEVRIEDGGWQTVAPSAIRFSPHYPLPLALSEADIVQLVQSFGEAAARALRAGFSVIEIHAAHGYLINEFLSPLANQRTDAYGGSFQNRIRFLLQVVQAVRGEWPDHLPLFVRISATDWVEGGWTGDDSVALARTLKDHGVDVIDCSTGGTVSDAIIPVGPNYQVEFAARVRREASIPTMAVGLITEAAQADAIIRQGEADLVALARADLRDPNWPLHAARQLGCDVPWPPQYARANI